MEREVSKDIQLAKSDTLSHPLSFFQEDERFVFVFKKTQKLVSALYLITGFFKEEEPLKWKLRELGSRLLSESISLKDGGSSQRDKSINTLRILVLEVTALLEVARQSGMITEMNHDIISKEFRLLLSSFSLSSESYEEGKAMLKEEFFNVPPVPEKKTVQPPVVTESTQKDTAGEVHPGPSYLPSAEDISSLYANKKNRTQEGAKGQSSSEPKLLKEFGAVAVKKNSRQSIIISLLKRKKEIMIKDVSPLIHGCSEKTIQRELLAMVQSGILHKEGEKRWSRYSLAESI